MWCGLPLEQDLDMVELLHFQVDGCPFCGSFRHQPLEKQGMSPSVTPAGIALGWPGWVTGPKPPHPSRVRVRLRG